MYLECFACVRVCTCTKKLLLVSEDDLATSRYPKNRITLTRTNVVPGFNIFILNVLNFYLPRVHYLHEFHIFRTVFIIFVGNVAGISGGGEGCPTCCTSDKLFNVGLVTVVYSIASFTFIYSFNKFI